MRDGRISQHAFEVGLGDGCEVTNGHRQNRQDNQHGLPVGSHGDQAIDEQTHDDGERSKLGCGTNEQRDRGRGTVIDVRNPHVEGDDTQFESKAGNQEYEAEDHDALVNTTAVKAFCDTGNFKRAGSTVNHRHAIKQETGSQCAENEIFHRRFGRYHGIAVHGDHGIERQ